MERNLMEFNGNCWEWTIDCGWIKVALCGSQSSIFDPDSVLTLSLSK